jgi:hypothetical protein
LNTLAYAQRSRGGKIMANRKNGPRQQSDPTHGETPRPGDARKPDQTSAGVAGQQQDPKRRLGAFAGTGEHARQQQMGNKD